MYLTTSNKALLAILSLLLWTFPASAQLTRTTEATLKALRQGKEVVMLCNTAYHTADAALAAQTAASYRMYTQKHFNQWVTEQHNLAAIPFSDLSAAPGESLDIRVKRSILRQQTLQRLQQAKQQLESTLYRWGKLQDETNSLCYPQLASLTSQNNTVTLSLNGHTALIQTRPGKTGQLILLPEDIHSHASTVNALLEAYALFPEVLAQNKPQQMAGWFYLKNNFTNAWQEFQATQEAYKSLDVHRGLLSGLQNRYARHTNDGKRIVQNYHYAAANLALHSAKILQFMSVHNDIFPQVIPSYKQIMRLNNTNFGISQSFQRFWSESLIPAI